MKWMDGPSVTEINRGSVYEINRQTKFHKMEMLLKRIKFNTILLTGTIVWILVAFPCFGTFSIDPFHRQLLFPFL